MKSTMFKRERGITLIALVITIIVLLILAGVGIQMLVGDNGLLTQAQNAKTEFANAAEKEKDNLSALDYEMAKLQNDPDAVGKTQDEFLLGKRYGDPVEIGDTVNYNAGVDGYDGGWKVLGVEGNKVLLLSTKIVESDFELKGIDGYNNGISKLNAVCAPYGKGTGAVGARCLKAEDIHELADVDLTNVLGTGKPENQGETFEYGNTGTYKISNGTLYYTGSNGTTGTGASKNPAVTTFMQVENNGAFLADNIEYKATNNWFSYLIGPTMQEEVWKEGETFRKIISQKKLDMLKGTDGVAENKYWLATQTIMTRPYGVSWGLADMNIHTSGEGLDITRGPHLFNSRYATVEEGTGTVKNNVRAVVILDEDVTLKKQADGSFNIE